MRKPLAMLLALLMLPGNGACFAHAHGVGDVAEPAGHALRPHLHLHAHGGHAHHRHSGDRKHASGHRDRREAVPLACPLSDHDSDAIYLTAGEMLPGGRNTGSGLVSGQLANLAGVFVEAERPDLLYRSHAGWWSHPPPDAGSGCPLYLRTLTLRC